MKVRIFCLFMLVFTLIPAMPCFAEIDPILLAEPNENVFGCNNDIFIRIMEKATIGKNTSGRNAVDNYLFFKIKILFLANTTWPAIDKTSFSLKFVNENGVEEAYPLDYAITMMTNLRNGWETLSEPLSFTSLSTINLVFNVIPTSKESWTLLFRPTNRGSEAPYCEVEIPLSIK